MFFCLILINILRTNEINNHEILMDNIFKRNYKSNTLSMEFCRQNNFDSFHFRGNPINIKEINNTYFINNMYISNYNFIYLSEEKYLKYTELFPDSTIFLIPNRFYKNISLSKKTNCFLELNMNIRENTFYYIIIGKYADEKVMNLVIKYIFILFFILFFMVLIIIARLFYLKIEQEIYIYSYYRIVVILSNIIPITCILLHQLLLSYIFYSLYKSYIIINLIFLVNGFSIINNDYNDNSLAKLTKFIIYFFFFDAITSIVFIYIIYFIPQLNNHYLFLIRNIIEHIILLAFTIKALFKIFIPLYRQFRIENELRNMLANSYKIKLIFQGKIIAFSLLYSVGFILFPFIEMLYNVHNYAKVFYYSYYFKIILEMFYGILFSIIFFPIKISLLDFLPIYFVYENKQYISEINNNEKDMNISKITKNLIQKEFQEKSKSDLSIVFVNPFYKKNNLFNNLYVGVLEN